MGRDFCTRLVAIRNTLEKIKIESTYDNMSRLLGCMQEIDKMIEEAQSHDADDNA